MPKINKNIIIGISIVALLFFAGIIGWVLFQKEKIPFEEELTTPEEKLIKEQIEQLDILRGDQKPYSEEDIAKQTEELERLHQQFEVEPLTEEDIKKQLEELDKLRELQQ